MTLVQALGSGLLISFAAFGSLSMSMNKHYRQVWQTEITPQLSYLLRIAGICMLAIVWWLEIHYWQLAVGTVIWLAVLSLAAIMWVSLLSFVPQKSGWLIFACLLLVSGWLMT